MGPPHVNRKKMTGVLPLLHSVILVSSAISIELLNYCFFFPCCYFILHKLQSVLTSFYLWITTLLSYLRATFCYRVNKSPVMLYLWRAVFLSGWGSSCCQESCKSRGKEYSPQGTWTTAARGRKCMLFTLSFINRLPHKGYTSLVS